METKQNQNDGTRLSPWYQSGYCEYDWDVIEVKSNPRGLVDLDDLKSK